jgi:hypothetical protein
VFVLIEGIDDPDVTKGWVLWLFVSIFRNSVRRLLFFLPFGIPTIGDLSAK